MTQIGPNPFHIAQQQNAGATSPVAAARFAGVSAPGALTPAVDTSGGANVGMGSALYGPTRTPAFQGATPPFAGSGQQYAEVSGDLAQPKTGFAKAGFGGGYAPVGVNLNLVG